MIIRQFQAHPFSFFTFSSKSISHFNPFASRSLSLSSEFKQPAEKIEVENHYEDKVEEKNEGVVDGKVRALKEKIEVVGIHGDFIFTSPGEYLHLICPKCKGGQSVERSLSFYINPKTEFAFWRCFRVECGWAGQVFLDDREARKAKKKSSCGRMTEENLLLEPLGHELTAYFSERLISKEVLQKNGVMQLSTEKNVIAFTYRRNGVLVNCKYRSVINKKFWQEKGAEKILYGLDDIKDADEIIIVEGEMDKLSMEQAGLTNSVSVPGGAPQRLSTKELPSLDKDSSFPYLWNCKEYLDKASKIILATDGDRPGQVLAEELARRLGRERCWLVSWPKKDDFCCFKDANEVLTTLGADALRDVVKNAVLYRCKT